MALKSIEYTVAEEGEDCGKVFVITRMSAFDADRWGRHVLHAALAGGYRAPDGDDVAEGMGSIAEAGMRIFGMMAPEAADTLLDRLMQCVRIIRDPAHPTPQPVIPADIQEVGTVGLLQMEAMKLHTDFFSGASVFIFLPVAQLLLAVGEDARSVPTSRAPSPA
ncbi:hypothetical protein NO263_09990 [Gluconacetobacter entanii]|uniref:Uncharacterized protein n=2 Tax=Gluconacetobacter entanii TaxID=108528 RepID=A0ABT3K661_9PROT|nr:hypothetical protein [Gluconacetobacter entanii]MCW4590910.1 hypothetical protein [Gluconacetobacter entanii]